MNENGTSLSTAWAPAKVNLYLHVGRAQSDGRHPLDSLVQFADVRGADRVSVRPSPTLSLEIEGAGAKALKGEKNNLVQAAALKLRAASGRSDLGAALYLVKELPVAAGVGGGSADAAATLQLLNRFWNIGFGTEALRALSAELGADVPACLSGAPVIMRGTGELLTGIDAPSLPAVLVNPGVKVATSAVYRKFDDMGLGEGFKELDPPRPTKDIVQFAASLKAYANDLEAPAIALCPAIREVLERLASDDTCLLARMSGSGATCFALYPTMEMAEEAAANIARRKKKWWVRATLLSGTV